MQINFEEESRLWSERKETVIQEINQSGLPLVLFGKAAAFNNSFLKEIPDVFQTLRERFG